MPSTRRIIFLLSVICSLLVNYKTQAQTDTTIAGTRVVQLNDSSYLLYRDTLCELWIKDKSLDIWRLSADNEILTYDKNRLRIWKQGDRIALWFYAPGIDDWRVYKTMNENIQKINDSITSMSIDDTTKLISINNKELICYSSDKLFSWNIKHPGSMCYLEDSVQIQNVNDTVNLYIKNDSIYLWYLDKLPKIWKVSESTTVWSINELTEFWRAGNNYKLWRRKSLSEQWEPDEKSKPKIINEGKSYWSVNDSVMICHNADSVGIWKANRQKPLWRMGDSIVIWKITLPEIDTSLTDTIPKVVKQVKKAELWDLDKTIKLWSINDSTKLYTSIEKIELWHVNRRARLWKLSDSTLIWNLNKDSKISLLSDSINLWIKNDSTFEWSVDTIRKPRRINENLVIFDINDSLRYTQIKDSTVIWNSGSNAKIARIKRVNYLHLNDTTELWEPNDSTKLWIDKYGSEGDIWERNKRVNILNINDSTKIWQINESVRLSIIKGKLKIWQQGRGDPYLSWKESKGFKSNEIDDTIKIWYIDDNTIIWETKHKIEVWNKNDQLNLYRLNDTSLVWTYSPVMIPKPIAKPKYWTYTGTGKIDIAQVWVDNWVPGGENSLSSLFILNFQANYNKKKIKWNNDFEYRYGFLKPGDEDLRKNEDKIKINSAFNYYAFKKYYYGLTNTLQTQFFKGYKYETDTSYIVSDWAAPLYYTVALGLNYFPIKQLSVFFSPFTNKLTYVNDTVLVDQTSYGVPEGQKMKNEPGAIIKSVLNWDITKNINVVSKLDLFTRYKDLEQYNVDWETTLTFKFNNFVNATLNAHLTYDPDVTITDSHGNEINPVQFKEVLSIGLFYKI